MLVDRDVQPAGEVAGLERGHDLLADDAAGGGVGHGALERLRDLMLTSRSFLATVDQQAVADFLAADFQLSATRCA